MRSLLLRIRRYEAGGIGLSSDQLILLTHDVPKYSSRDMAKNVRGRSAPAKRHHRKGIFPARLF